MSRARTAAPRSLADELRTWDDDALAALLNARPDLAVPIPTDFTTLASRIAGRASTQRVVDDLDTAALQVLEVLAVLPEPVTATHVGRVWGAPAAAPLERLRRLGLVWGPPRALRVVRSAREVLGPHPAGLGPPLAEALGRRSPQRLAGLLEDLGLPPAPDPDRALEAVSAHLSATLADPQTARALLEHAPDGAHAVLDRLAWGPPVGQVPQADRSVRVSSAGSGVEWLLARGLLAVADPAHVVLPREVGMALRGGRVHRHTETGPPPVQTRPADARAVTGTAVAASAEAVRLVAALADRWGEDGPPLLRAGGLGMRELRRVATALEVDEGTAALVVELTWAAGLVADDGEAEPRWTPTPAYDVWLAGTVGERWVTLAQSWARTTRVPHLVGTRDARGTVRVALGDDLDRPAAPGVRHRAVAELAAAPAAVAVEVASLRDRLDWWAPRRAAAARQALLEGTLRETAWLGVTGAGALSDHGRALRDDPEGAATLLDAALPEPVDHVMLQADLTAVAPGPPSPALARTLALAADVESRGGATVYRFTTASVRRALDAGMTGDDLIAALTRHSRTPVPQPLGYLVAETSRRHGQLRVGVASAYVRCDDEALLRELLADRRAIALRLRRLAPTVLTCQAPADTVLELLRSMGLAPAAESADGDIVVHRPLARRTPARDAPRPVAGPPRPSRAALAGAVAALRAAETAARDTAPAGTASPALVPMDAVAVLAVLREAASSRRPVWIGVVDASGRPSRLLVEPLLVEAGRVSVFDRGSEQVRSFSAHRITGVAEQPEPGARR
jgi:hypothetical protein